MIKIIVNGAAGRMGKTVISLIEKEPKTKLVGAIDIGGDLKSAVSPADVVIDFSSAEATEEIVRICKNAKKSLLIATTGQTDSQKKLIKEASKEIPIIFSPNLSIGVNLLWKLSEIACKTLDDSFKIDIEERHHIHKKDSPSGTAKKLIEIAEGSSKKPASVNAIREGEIVGDHTVTFTSKGEKIVLGHYAASREIFAQGAITAALWLAGKAPGLYTMQDVLF